MNWSLILKCAGIFVGGVAASTTGCYIHDRATSKRRCKELAAAFEDAAPKIGYALGRIVESFATMSGEDSTTTTTKKSSNASK